LKAIRALWVTAHNTPQAVEKMEREFLFLVGEIVEGTAVEKLVMNNISKDAFLREFHDG
jgi:ABC-type lipopolysaccharide export system ATPase subunit